MLQSFLTVGLFSAISLHLEFSMSKIRRRQSDPTVTPPSAQQASSDTATLSNISPPMILNSPRTLEENAVALTRMSYEVGVSVNRVLAEQLEDRTRKLMVSVADETDFRRKNEQRLDVQEKEIEAIKAQSKSTQEKLANEQELYDKMIAVIRRYDRKRKELEDGYFDVMERLELLESSFDARAAQLQLAQQQNETSLFSKRRRIKEAIRSTQRWNLEHKRTILPDSQFATDYFKKQAKRDPEVARIIQQSLKQRIRRRQHGRLKSQPQSLEEFCQDVQWKDILDTAEEILARGEIKTLKRMK